MSETCYTLEEPEIDRYRKHGITYVDFFVPDSPSFEIIHLCGLDKLFLDGLPKPKYAWVKKPNSKTPKLVIASSKTNRVPNSSIELNQTQTLEFIVVQLLQRKSGICESTIIPKYNQNI